MEPVSLPLNLIYGKEGYSYHHASRYFILFGDFQGYYRQRASTLELARCKE